MNLDGGGSQSFDDTNRKLKGDRRQALRASVDKAALAVRRRDVDGVMPVTPTRNLTKQERLARNTGSEDERRSTRGSVAAAIAKMADVHMDTDVSDPMARSVRDVLRQRYPGRSLSDILARGEQLQAALHDDPVAARQDMLSAYSRGPVEGLPAYKAPAHDHGVRGSIQRARQDQTDQADLAAAEKRHGKNLPNILAQLEAMDRALHTNPALASARIAAAHGAPATQEQIPAYQAKQAAKGHAKAIQARFDALHRHIVEGIQGGHIPGDAASLNEMAAVMQSPRFKHHPTDGTDTLRRAAAIVTHPGHVRLTGKSSARNAGPRRDAGSLSIGGGSPGRAATGAQRYGTGGSTRDAIRNAVSSY